MMSKGYIVCLVLIYVGFGCAAEKGNDSNQKMVGHTIFPVRSQLQELPVQFPVYTSVEIVRVQQLAKQIKKDADEYKKES